MRTHARTAALLWRARGGVPVEQTRNYERLQPVVEALGDRGLEVHRVLYSDERHKAVRARLLTMDTVLVWVDPVDDGTDRTTLDAVLRDVADRGVQVSAHPATIAAMGTKEVLVRTKELGWGTDSYTYETKAELRDQLPQRLGHGRSRVLKEDRSNGGLGVWRASLIGSATAAGLDAMVRVQHAAPRHHMTEDVRLGEFIDRWTSHFDRGGKVIDQPYLPSVADGLIRAYLVVDMIVGFATQEPVANDEAPADTTFGLPSAKTMHDPDSPLFATLRRRVETEWVTGMCSLVGLDRGELPVLWDADFLRGTQADGGDGSYVLCEINASSVLPFPPQAPRAIADAIHRRLTSDT
jgi:hypothetical protein